MSSARFEIVILAGLMIACSSGEDSQKLAEFSHIQVGPDSLAADPDSLMTSITAFSIGGLRISKYDDIIKKYSRRYGFDWRLIAAQIFVESRFRNQARSGRGAIGLMQIMPGTARHLGVEPSLLLKPEHNIALGCRYNRELFDLWQDKEGLNRLAFTLASYNAGRSRILRAESRVNSDGRWLSVRPLLPRETRNYVGRIFNRYDEYKERFF